MLKLNESLPLCCTYSAAAYGLQPIAELQSGVSLTDDDILQSYTTTSSANNQSPFAAAVPNTIGQFSPLGGASSFDMQPVTIMQRLQAERRKRLMDYQHKLLGRLFAAIKCRGVCY